MKGSRAMALGTCLAINAVLTGCTNPVLMDVAAGVQEATATTATGIIDTFLAEHFSVEARTQAEEGGNELFVQL